MKALNIWQTKSDLCSLIWSKWVQQGFSHIKDDSIGQSAPAENIMPIPANESVVINVVSTPAENVLSNPTEDTSDLDQYVKKF